MGCVYMATSPDGRSYIGVTRHSPDVRWQQHCSMARRRHSPGYFAAALRQFRPETFVWRVLLIADDAAFLKEMEVRAIEAYGTLYPHGLNATVGGDGVSLDAATEIRRRRSSKKARSTKQFKKLAANIQRDYWTEERCRERAALIRQKWQDPAYRERLLASRKKPLQTAMLLRPAYGVASKRYWKRPEFRERVMEARKAAMTPELRVQIAETQRRVMEDPEARLRIAVSLNRYRNCVFRKGAEPRLPKFDRGGLLQDTIPKLPTEFSCAEAVRLGWMGREFSRALDRGWIVKVSGDAC